MLVNMTSRLRQSSGRCHLMVSRLRAVSCRSFTLFALWKTMHGWRVPGRVEPNAVRQGPHLRPAGRERSQSASAGRIAAADCAMPLDGFALDVVFAMGNGSRTSRTVEFDPTRAPNLAP
jgi:hypothetical protein